MEERNKTLKRRLFIGLATLLFSYPSVAYANEAPAPAGSPVSVMQSATVKGSVIDEAGDPIIGATVQIKGKPSVGTITDVDGNFSIAASPKDVLVVSYLGYTNREVRVDNQRNIIITLKEEATALSEVVVTAFGTGQKKESIVGSIQTVRARDLEVPTSNLSTSFAGRLSGVVAYQRSGQPGANGANFYIRGISTLSGVTNPLIVIDGVEASSADLNALDPEVIDGFSILKDATATAMYGSRGANGVMIVTTKGGADTDRPIISARIEGNISSPTKVPEFVDGVTFMKMHNAANISQFGNAAAGNYSAAQIANTGVAGANPYIYPNVDWYNELFKGSAFNQKVNFNIRGGNKKLDYFMNVAVNHETGMLKNRAKDYGMSYDNNIDYRRYAFQNNLNFHMSKSSTISLHLNVMLSDLDGPNAGISSIYSSVMNSSPVDCPITYPSDEETPWLKWGVYTGGNTQGATNAMAELTKGYNNTFESTVLANLDFEQKLDMLTKGLRFKAMVSFKNWSQSNTSRSQGYNRYGLTGYEWNPEINDYDILATAQGDTNKPVLGTSGSTQGDRRIYFQTYLDYARQFGDHNVGAMVLFNLDQYNVNNVSDLYSALPKRKEGLAFRATYDYDGRYMVEFNAGYNGSENFAEGHRFGFFPAVAVGYNVSSEKFFEPLRNVINHFKIRGSYGLVGNDQIGGERFVYLADVTLQSKSFKTGYGNKTLSLSGPAYNRYQNNDITWEVGRKLNVGFDLSMFRGLTIVFDAFREIRSDIFQQKLSIPNYLGTAESKVFGNLAKVKNWGFDLSADYNKQITKDFSAQFKGTFTYARNKVLEYDEAPGTRPAMSKIGHPVNSIWGYVSDGLYIDDADIANSATSTLGNQTIKPGDIKYVDQPDANGNYDGQITGDDQVVLGHPTVPEIVYGFGPSFRYKDFDFSFFFQGVTRTSIMMSGFHPFGTGYNRGVLQFIADDYWSEANQNPDAAYPRITKENNNNNTASSDFWLRDGSFLKLKNAEVGYSFKNMRFYVSGANLLTFSPFKYWDPEMGGGSGLAYPTQRVVNFGFQVSFK